MLAEIGMLTGISYLLYQNLFGKKTEKEVIESIFKNTNFGIGDQLPTRIYTHKKDAYTIYGYKLPFGLTDNDKLQNIIKKTLNKPTEIIMENRHLKIKIYKEDLQVKYKYNWQETEGWTVPIGYTLNGLIHHDFDKIPHMTIAGMTRQGKTVLLKLIFAHLIHNHPEDVEFYIIDLKGGLEFGRYSNFKQIKTVASNVQEAYKLLKQIHKNINDDMSHFKQHNYSNILETNLTKRTFIITDEGAQLTPSKHHSTEEKKMFNYCQEMLSEVCRVAGALGYRNIFCTQYPTADTLPRQIKQNSDAKISFRLPTEVASRVAIDEMGAEQINNVGRAIYRTHERQLIQVPYVTDSMIQKQLGVYRDDSNEAENTKARGNTINFG